MSKRVAMFSLFSLFLFSGCYKFVEVSTSELPKLNHAYESIIGSYSSGNSTRFTKASSIIMVQTTKGALEEIMGNVNVRLTLNNGKTIYYKHPLSSEILPDGSLSIASSNQPRTSFKPGEIRKAEIKQYDGIKTLIVTSSILAIPLIVLLALL